jgi:hypothetical protein
MNRLLTLCCITLACLALQPGTLGQDSGAQQLAVPLSDPSRPVQLSVSVFSGAIRVTAYEGNEVIVLAKPHDVDDSREPVDGMRRIPNTSLGLTIEEQNNEVNVGGDWTNRAMDLEIQVPARTSAQLTTINGGDIIVRGLTGEVELANTNGGIEATDIRGSVVANTTNGDVRVSFVEIDTDKAMSFTTLNGDVDTTFPPGLRAELRIDAGRGEILTDFDFEVKPSAPVVDRGERGGGYRVELSSEVQATVGGGGPVFHFKTFNGNVYVRKAGG